MRITLIKLMGLFTLAGALTGIAGLRAAPPARAVLRAGFAEVDITPKLGGKPVYMAGFGHNRLATGVLDPIMCRAVVFDDGASKLGLVSVDLVGLFLPSVENVRKRLPGFGYVMVSSTHNHEGPDTVGLWGPSLFKSGIDQEYMDLVESKIVECVQAASARLSEVDARIGKIAIPDLLHDGREPYVKHDELICLDLRVPGMKPLVGLIVQWNCHPETLADKNTQLSADYVATTVEHLKKKYSCPVIYFTGTVGGLMTSLHVPIKDEQGRELKDGSVEKTQTLGRLVGQAAERAISAGAPITLTPIVARSKDVYLPFDNPTYQVGRRIGVLKREGYVWQGNPYKVGPLVKGESKDRLAMRTEVGYLKLGELEVALIPGEIYPELVLSKIQDPVDPGADFPDALPEPGIYAQLKGKHQMIIGLANDEVGYILPKRQWDEKPPFCYGRKKSQYGEINSVGAETAPILCNAFKALVEGK